MTETVLVTGGTGYLAGWCLVELLRRGYRVRTTIRSPGREAAVRVAVGAVDVRDVADLHIRAMIAPGAESERFIATGELLWMGEMAAILREQLGPAAAKVPAKPMPDLLVRMAAPFNPELRTLLPLLGRKLRHSSAKAQRMLGWQPRPAADTVVDSGRSIVGWSSDL